MAVKVCQYKNVCFSSWQDLEPGTWLEEKERELDMYGQEINNSQVTMFCFCNFYNFLVIDV